MKQRYLAHERLQTYAQSDAEQIFQDLEIPQTGYTQAQVEKARDTYGENTVSDQKNDTVLSRLRRSFINPFSIVLFILAVISFFTDVIFASNFSRDIRTVIIIVIMLLISGIVRFVQEMRSKNVTDRLERLVNTTVQVRRDGSWKELPSDELVVGDAVRLEAGDRVPADIRLIRAVDCFVSQSIITGESSILEKSAKPLREPPSSLSDYENTIFRGSTMMGGACTGLVLAVGKDTVYGNRSYEEQRHPDGFDRGENAIAWVLVRFMAILTPIVFVACGITKNNWLAAFLFALSVAVALMPELLPMVITACLARGSAQMGSKQTIVKNVNAMQGFGSMDVLCVDKTGTLTGDTVVLEYYMDILGNESQEVLDCAYLNSYYHTGVANHLDAAILKARKMPDRGEYYDELVDHNTKLDEIPFDYNRNFSSVLVRKTEGRMLLVKGSLEQVIAQCRYVQYQGSLQEIRDGDLASVHAVVDEMLEDGMKILAVAQKELDQDGVSLKDEHDLTLLGYLAFFDAPKQSAASAIGQLHQRHMHVKLLTGDHADVAVSICRRLGIPTDHLLTGEELEEVSENDMPIVIERTRIFAELSPSQKAYIVDMLHDNGHTVGFLGDGMNDLPAVTQADVGISVDTAADAVKDAADVILLKKDLNVLNEGVVEGRKAFANMSKYVKITASSNFGNICAIVVASILLPFFPMTSVQLLLLNLLYDILCLALPWDRVDSDVLQKPLEWSGTTLARFMGYFGPISAVFDVLTFAFLYLFLCPFVCGGSFSLLDSGMQAQFVVIFQTGWFLESLWTQILALHLLRTKETRFIHNRASRPVILVTVIGAICFTVLALSPLGTFIGMTAMPPIFFVFLVVIVALYLLLVAGLKRIYISKYKELT